MVESVHLLASIANQGSLLAILHCFEGTCFNGFTDRNVYFKDLNLLRFSSRQGWVGFETKM